LYGRLVTGLDGTRESWSVETTPLNLVFRSGDEIQVAVTPQGERLDEPFEVSDGVVIAPGDYGFTRVQLSVETGSKRPIVGEARYTFGGFYDGTLHTFQASLLIRPVSAVAFTLEGEINRGDLPEGTFTADLVAARIRLGFSPDLDLSSFVQYDTESRSLGTNTRFRWSFHPLGDLFVVYNHNIDRPAGSWVYASNELLLKVKYGFRY
jgi:hypothetical protein